MLGAVLAWIAFGAWLFHYTWTLFAAVMNARRVRDLGKLSAPARWMTIGALLIGYPLDVLANLAFSFVLWEWPQVSLPRSWPAIAPARPLRQWATAWLAWFKAWLDAQELLLSARLWRLSNGEPGWRRDRAEWWRSRFLDWFDDRGLHRG